MLLGIAIILFGIAYRVVLISYVVDEFLLSLIREIPFIGIVVTIVGYFTAKKNS